MKLRIYARVSTQKSNVEKDVQEMIRWCNVYNHEIVSITKDKESGRIPLKDRVKFKEILSQMPFDDADGLLVIALDRVSRNWYDQNVIEKAFVDNWEKCKLISVFDRIELGTSAGRLLFRIQFGISCFEVERMFERQALGIAESKKQGKYKGRKKGSKNKKKKINK
jgi:DNA invertase Pin-like site-specific DNA recombinase